MAIKDLKKPKMVREVLDREQEVVLTKDGQPFAILVGIAADGVEESLAEIRRAMFSSTVRQARQRASANPPSGNEIAEQISQSRKERNSR